MKTMIAKTVAALACAALAFAAEAAGGVALTMDEPVSEIAKTHSGDSKSGNKRNKKMTDTYRCRNTYSGKVVSSGAGKEPVTVAVEAYFVTRRLGEKRYPDMIDGQTTVGTYTFQPGTVTVRKFSFRAPDCVYHEHMRQTGNRRRKHVETTVEGKRHIGVIVRVVSGGEVLHVATYPWNSQWASAAGRSSFTLDDGK